MLYYNLSAYLRENYGKRMKKICIDGGFTCPNRDGKCGTGGCIFCSERGSGEHIDANFSIREQVQRALSASKEDDLFIAYFQNFTNTYAPIEILRERYDSALCDERIKILSVGTRPDCISEEVCALLASYAKTREVWVELGLQTASDRTAEIINRGYVRAVFENAMRLLRKYGLKVVVHVIIGLPQENLDSIKETSEYLSRFSIFGIKIHSIYVTRGTRLYQMYENGEYIPPTEDEYLEACAWIISHLDKETVIHRLTGDAPRGERVIPEWNADKYKLLSDLEKYMRENNLSQGSLKNS